MTWLFVPGDRPGRFDKAVASGADRVILDLEDAVRPEARDAALADIAAWLAGGNTAWVRLSGPDADTRLPGELKRLRATGGVAGAVLPKCSDPSEVTRVAEEIDAPVVALVETARGITALADLARAPGIAGFAFGGLDFVHDSGIVDPDALRGIRTQIALCARSHGLPPPIDGVTATFDDTKAVLTDARESKGLGFGGKLCIHPRQVPLVRRGFAPTANEISKAREVLEAAEMGGASAVHGSMVDAPVVARARNVLAAAETGAGEVAEEGNVLRERIVDAFAGIPPGWEDLADLDPEFVSSFADFVAPKSPSPALPAKIRALLSLAVAVSPTTLDASAVERHTAAALDEGASERDLLEVIELVSLLGIHSLTAGLPLINGLIGGCSVGVEADDEDRRGYWAAFERHFPGFEVSLREQLPGVDSGYRSLSRAVWRPGGLAPKWRELVFVVADLATTHLFTQGAALHLENALHYGARPAEIAEALALTLALGGRSVEIGIPALMAARRASNGAKAVSSSRQKEAEA